MQQAVPRCEDRPWTRYPKYIVYTAHQLDLSLALSLHSVPVGLLQYSGTCLRWSLCKAATSLKQPAPLVPDSTKASESTSAEQPPLYKGQLELAHRRLS